MPLHTPTVAVPRRSRFARVAAITAASCATAGAVSVAIADGQTTGRERSVAVRLPAVSRYFDLEANKANGMRALARHLAEAPTSPTPRYEDLEANKARSRERLGLGRAGARNRVYQTPAGRIN